MSRPTKYPESADAAWLSLVIHHIPDLAPMFHRTLSLGFEA
jgi:hypothetical protein